MDGIFRRGEAALGFKLGALRTLLAPADHPMPAKHHCLHKFDLWVSRDPLLLSSPYLPYDVSYYYCLSLGVIYLIIRRFRQAR
jgi:hypothetical protein